MIGLSEAFLSFVVESENVNLLEFKTDLKSVKLARKLLMQAKENEPLITKDLKFIAKLTESKMVGLKDKFKSENSLTRKIKATSALFNIPLEKVARRINDTLRFTLVISETRYAEGFSNALNELEKKGYRLSPQRIFNAWQKEGSENDTGYRGINVTVISSQNQIFELQFHTVASFQLKTETHELYEESRETETPAERKAEIVEIMLKKAARVGRPQGI